MECFGGSLTSAATLLAYIPADRVAGVRRSEGRGAGVCLLSAVVHLVFMRARTTFFSPPSGIPFFWSGEWGLRASVAP